MRRITHNEIHREFFSPFIPIFLAILKLFLVLVPVLITHEEVGLAGVAGVVLLLHEGGAALVPDTLADILVIKTMPAQPSLDSYISALDNIHFSEPGTTVSIFRAVILI